MICRQRAPGSGQDSGLFGARGARLIIDMVVSSILLSMGMMMLPPVVISLPFKVLLFVLVDGWGLVVESLMRSF
jgi:flagellar biosynthesis protein FliP